MNFRRILNVAVLGLVLALLSAAQAQTPSPVAAKPAAAPAPDKTVPPAPITQVEKDAFHRAYTEYLELQNKYATQMLALKTQLQDLEKKSNEEVGPRSQAIQQMFQGLSARCVAPKVFDRLSADCEDKAKE